MDNSRLKMWSFKYSKLMSQSYWSINYACNENVNLHHKKFSVTSIDNICTQINKVNLFLSKKDKKGFSDYDFDAFELKFL